MATSGFPLGARSIVEHVTSAAQAWDVAPAISDRAQQLLRDPQLERKRVIELIEADVLLTTRVLQLANAPYFGQSRQVHTVAQAVAVVGDQAARSAAATLLQNRRAAGSSSKPSAIGGDVRLRALAAACAARAITVTRAPGLQDVAFAGALLADIGMILLDRAFGADYGKVLADCPPHRPLTEFEDTCLGINHAHLGAMILSQWGLSETIVHLVRMHHDEQPDATLTEKERDIFLVLRFANDCAKLLTGARDPQTARQVFLSAQQHVGLSADTLRAMMPEISRQFRRVSQWLLDERGAMRANPRPTAPVATPLC